MIKRDAEEKLTRLAEGFPAVRHRAPSRERQPLSDRYFDKPYASWKIPIPVHSRGRPRSFLAQFAGRVQFLISAASSALFHS